MDAVILEPNADAASLRNLKPWRPGQSGNLNVRPRSPRVTAADQQAIVAALSRTLTGQRSAPLSGNFRRRWASSRTALKALRLCARLNVELSCDLPRILD
jgi:hypothetical protein